MLRKYDWINTFKKLHEIQRKKTTGYDIVRLLFGDDKK